MKAGIAGFGVWARGLEGVDAFIEAQGDDFCSIESAVFSAPKPKTVPPKERRRAGLMINLAVEVAHQACEHAGADKTTIPSVFVSALGDTVITDYMCRKLSQPEKLLSPTKFHNSVHNAPSGYWTISSENRMPSSFVGGFRESFGAGLLEAASQAHAFSTPVLLVAYDIENSAPFNDIEAVADTLGVALVVTNGESSGLEESSRAKSVQRCDLSFEAALETDSDQTFSAAQSAGLRQFAQRNPVGEALAVLEQFVEPRDNCTLDIAAAPAATLRLSYL